MKFSPNTAIVCIIVLMVGINIAIFVRGIGLSNEIHYYESELHTLKQQNIEFEQRIYTMSSYTLTASLAAELDYGKYNDPIYQEEQAFALNQ